MLDSLTSYNSRDFRQRYRGVYGWFTPPSTKRRILVKVVEVDEYQVIFEDEHRASYNAIANTGVQFEFIPISKKLFRCNKTIYCAERVPARQWTRGVAGANTRITNVVSGGAGPVSFAIVKAAFVDTADLNKKAEITDFLEGSISGLLLNEMFCLAEKGVYLYSTLIGTYDLDKHTILLDDGTFRQELVDAVNELNLPFIVGVKE